MKTVESHSKNDPCFYQVVAGVDVTLLGTAHVSHQSVEDVKNFIQEKNPDVVMVELCEARYKALTDKNRWKNLDVVQVIREKKLFLLMSSLILSSFQKKIGAQLDIQPGAEMLVAIETTKKQKKIIELGDRDVQLTLKRAWSRAGFFGRLLLFSELLSSLFVKVELAENEIEEMKKKDIIEDMFRNLPSRYQTVKNVILDERDEYLALNILQLAQKYEQAQKKVHILVVVGMGHVVGIQSFLNKYKTNKPVISERLASLTEYKKANRIWLIFKSLLPILGIMSLFLYFTGWDNPQKIYTNWIAWCIIKFSCSAFMVLIALGHPLTILLSGMVAPISNFNPILKPGWVAAFLEAKMYKPQVKDFENFVHDVDRISTLLKNRLGKIFALFFLPQLGSSIGTFLALWYIAQQ